jgi:hypothetical protein
VSAAIAFERVINRWTNLSGDFASLAQWRRCVDRAWSPQTRGRGEHLGGLDLGLTR